MDVKELKEYLDTFKEDDGVSLIVIDGKKRVVYEDKSVHIVEDGPNPAIIMDISEAKEKPFEKLGEEEA